ncbi:MBL fold metallo-hydrolase [Rothia sp. ZJ932]|nr:MBL fold metallo-hydrolase [Rothia sp. ZJ1223]QRZ62595.1 MBL fold metallo-hydrolase [Rothia sp. ZJ932]
MIYNGEHYTIRSISVSEMENNVYLLTAKEDGLQVLIDAADDVDAIEKFAADALAQDVSDEGEPVGVVAILTTHGHWDHIRALPAAARLFDATTYAGEDDMDAIAEQEGFNVDMPVDSTVVHFGDIALEATNLVGHTPGSIMYTLTDAEGEHPAFLFTGDSLFPGGVGKTNSPEDFTSLISDVEREIFGKHADDAVVLPGHGKSTTVGNERPHLDEWKERGW